ncbi:MAG TPA: DUF1080 domain-containing protein [Phycisphaerales bacterium]|nr:DUF1080 domain-containing protein [Phycisphaerales bacterium]HMP36882.1 DUF1080 domain-containing protein [Phycisphaerales bacterium]
MTTTTMESTAQGPATQTSPPIAVPTAVGRRSAGVRAVRACVRRRSLAALATAAIALTPALGAAAGGAGAATPPAAPATSAAIAPPNTLTPAERAAGWRLLFDGRSGEGWRGFRRDGFPAQGWSVEEGVLKVRSGGGDLITTEQFGDFELALEFLTTPKANSGIMYRVIEEHGAPWQTGPEFQILDDHGHGLAPSHPHSAGALYDLAAPPPTKVLRPAGEWNSARILLRDGRLRHWLNDVKVVDLRVDGDDWAQLIKASKFKDYAGFGVRPRGHIALQDHGDEVWFRTIKLRDTGAAMPGERALFNGRDLDGLIGFLPDGTDPAQVWSVRDGVLICAGKPAGYIRTTEPFESYVLKLEWRWPEGKEPGNSGVLLRLVGEDKVWPKSVEAQLHSGSAGDFWNIDEVRMSTDPERTRGRNTRKTHGNENPVGAWNEYEIVVDGSDIALRVNGEELNRAWDVEVVPGTIALQSEGAEIHFRAVRLAPILR